MSKKNTVSHLDFQIAQKYARIFSYPTKFLDKFLLFLPKGSIILDAGCGPGQNARHMCNKEMHVQGIDISKAMINIAKKKTSQAQFSIMNMKKIDFCNDCFDGIIVTFSLIFLSKTDIKKAMTEFYRVLKNKGKIYLAIHTGMGGRRFVSDPLVPSQKVCITLFEIQEIKNCLKNNGFCILWSRHIPPRKKTAFQFDKLFLIAEKI